MRNLHRWTRKFLILSLLSAALLSPSPAHAGNDPSIRGALRKNITASMQYFIESNTVQGYFHIYDAVAGKLLRLKFAKLHSGIVKKGDFYVSCADFVDVRGKKYDLDFLVIPDGGALRTTQALVHSVDKKKRKYHLEK